MKFTTEQQEKGTELVRVLAQKAWDSAEFKTELINNPIATIEKVTGKNLANLNKTIVVEDQTDANVIYINIPAKVDMTELELTEEQLEMIAGGVTPALVAYGAGVAIGFGLCWLGSKL